MSISGLALLATHSLVAPPDGAPHWTLGRIDTVCVLQREGQVEGKPFALQLSANLTLPEIVVELVADAKLAPVLPLTGGPLTISIGGTAVTTIGGSRSADAGRRLLQLSLPLETADRMPPDAADLTIVTDQRSITVPTPNLAGALSRLRSCHSAWLRSHGIDPAFWAAGRMPDLRDPARWFRIDDFPLEGLQYPSTKTIARLRIDAEGHVTSCDVIAAPTPSVGKTTCRIAIKRGSAKPAIDENGKPIAGVTFVSVVWSH